MSLKEINYDVLCMQSKPQRFVVVVITIAMLTPLIYFASIAPAFKIASNSEGLMSAKVVRRLYRPLLDRAPEVTNRYLALCGVSDIETFLVIQPAQGESP